MTASITAKPDALKAVLQDLHLPTLARATGFSVDEIHHIAALLWLGCGIDALPGLRGMRSTSDLRHRHGGVARAIGWTKRWRVFPESTRRHQTIDCERYFPLLQRWAGVSAAEINQISELLLHGCSLASIRRTVRCQVQIVRWVAAAQGWSSAWRKPLQGTVRRLSYAKPYRKPRTPS